MAPLDNAAQTFETGESSPHRVKGHATGSGGLYLTQGAMRGPEVEQNMEWLVFYLNRLIPPTFSCHRDALAIEPLAAIIHRSSLLYKWQATSEKNALSIHSFRSIHSWPGMSLSHEHFISVLPKSSPNCIFQLLYTMSIPSI